MTKLNRTEMKIKSLQQDVLDARNKLLNRLESVERTITSMRARINMQERVWSNELKSYSESAVEMVGELMKAQELFEVAERIAELIETDQTDGD